MNYPHVEILRKMAIPSIQHERIFTPELVSRIAGNYSPEAYIKLGDERSKEKLMPSDRIYRHLIDDCEQLSNIIVLRREAFQEPDITERREQYERLTRHIHNNIQTVIVPMLLKLDQINRELYAHFRYDVFTAAISSCTEFHSLSRIMVMHFFEFTCYSDKTQRMRVLELAVRKGKELLPTLPAIVFQQFMLLEEKCDCCFWLFLKYFDLAKSMRYNIRYKATGSGLFWCKGASDALLMSVDEEHTELLRALGKTNAMSSPIRQVIHKCDFEAAATVLERVVAEPAKGTRSSKMYITADTLRGNPRLSYTLYAIDYLITGDLKLDLPRARTNDLLMHLSPLFALDFECSVALVSGLHPRLGRASQGSKRARVQAQSPIYLLSEALVKMIWLMVGTHFEEQGDAGPMFRCKTSFDATGKRK